MYANNVDFSGGKTATVTTDGQLLIGSTASPHIKVGTLTSSDSSVTVTPGSGTISLTVAGGTTVGKTITGDTGGALSPTAGNWNIISNVAALNAGSSVLMSGSGSTLTLNVSDSHRNTIIGKLSGTSGITAFDVTSCGYQSVDAITSGNYTTSFGSLNLHGVTSGQANVALGCGVLNQLTYNGSYCIGIGLSAGVNYTGTESSNILISNDGVVGDNHTIRIGRQGSGDQQQNACYIAGIAGVSTSSSQMVTINSSTGQLGSTTLPPSGSVTQYDVLVGGASNTISSVGPGTAGQILQSGGNAANPAYSTATYPSTAGTSGKVLISNGTNIVSSTPTFPNASATSGKFIRSDGTNWIASTPTLPTTAGTSGKILISDGTNFISSTPTYPNTASGTGKILRADGTNWVATTATYPDTAGTSGNVLTSDGTNWVSSTPASGGITTINGNSGSITGSTVTIQVGANQGTVLFTNSSSTSNLTFDNTVTNNIGLGTNALYSVPSGTGNCAVGHNAGQSITTGSNNTIVGQQAGDSLIDGDNNTLLGLYAGMSLVHGSQNTIIGQNAGANYTGSESDNIIIGQGQGGAGGESHTIRIGQQGTDPGQQNLCYIAGITGATVTGTAVLCATDGQLGTVVSSERYKENIQPIDESVSIMSLSPKQFTFKSDETKTTQYGLIAEDVDKQFPYLCFYNSEGLPESVKYHELPTLLLKEIQRLNARIMSLETKMNG